MKRMWVMLLVVFLAACGRGSETEVSETVAREMANFDIQEASLLLWMGDGVRPGQHRADNPGELVLVDANGRMETVLELPQNTVRVYPCSQQASAPDGRAFAFFVGRAETGTLYQITNEVEEVAQVNAMTCLGMGTFQYAPDGTRFAYIDFAFGAVSENFAAGTLNVRQTGNREVLQTADSVVSFDFGDEVVALMSIFPDDQGEGTQAGVFRWRSGTPQEVTTLFPESGCDFRSGQVAAADDDNFVVLTLQACNRGERTWQLYTVDAANETSNQILAGRILPDGTTISSGSRVGYVAAAPDAPLAYFTYPNGNAQNVVNLERVALDAPQDDVPLVESVHMPRYATAVTNIYDPDDNARPVLSPDGRWLALVSDTVNTPAAVNIIDLNNPTAPRTIAAPNQGDTVSAMRFTPDSSSLLFVIGGHDGENNALFRVELATMLDERVLRGRYGTQMVVSPDGRYVALQDWQPEYLNLVVIDVETQQVGTLFEGARIVDGRVTDQRFVYPLAWRE